MTKRDALLGQLQETNERLREVLALHNQKDNVVRDSAIQRFGFTVDLAWRLIRAELMEYHKVTCTSPGECLREAFRQGIVADDIYWLKMIDMRNQTSHAYNQDMAERIYRELSNTQKRIDTLLAYFKKNEREQRCYYSYSRPLWWL